jgi:DNA replication and repair protein RecF
MELNSLKILNYRNILSLELRPGSGINIFHGDNGQGKTNLIEIIYLLGTLKSFRGGTNADFITRGQDNCRIKAGVIKGDSRHEIAIDIYPNGKKLSFDGKTPKGNKDFFSCLRPVVFAPEEVMIAKGSPALRRALLDRAIFQTDPGYLTKVRAYDLCLSQRNKALQQQLSSVELAPWTERLVHHGALIRQERHLYLQGILPLFREAYLYITENREEADIFYPSGRERLEELEGILYQDLMMVRSREMRHGQTLAGPHRDDLEFTIAGQPVKNHGSQGQQRSCILAFKTAQVLDLEARTGETPVLLLDDLNSELDRRRQDFYFNFLLTRSGQVFITTTDPQPFLMRSFKDAMFFQVADGRIMPDQEMRRQ